MLVWSTWILRCFGFCDTATYQMLLERRARALRTHRAIFMVRLNLLFTKIKVRFRRMYKSVMSLRSFCAKAGEHNWSAILRWAEEKRLDRPKLLRSSGTITLGHGRRKRPWLPRTIVERVCFRVFDNKRLGGVRQDDRSECLFTASRPYCVCIEKFTRVAKNKIVVVFTFNVLLTFY